MHVRWESASRYYEAVLQQDLLGDWVLSTARGGMRNRLGAIRHLALPSREAAVKEVTSLHKLRLRLKKFNYINDFVESCGLIPPIPLKGSKALQRDLGRLCDVAIHRKLLKHLMSEHEEPLEAETKHFLFMLESLREELIETLRVDLSESL